jgi:hypothetical protein
MPPVTRRARTESVAERDELGEEEIPETQLTSTMREEENNRIQAELDTPATSTEVTEDIPPGQSGGQPLTQEEDTMEAEIAELGATLVKMRRERAREKEVERRESALAARQREKNRLEAEILRIEEEEEREAIAEQEGRKRRAGGVLGGGARPLAQPFHDPVPLAIYQRAPKTKDLPQYNGKNYQEARSFFNQAEDK